MEPMQAQQARELVDEVGGLLVPRSRLRQLSLPARRIASVTSAIVAGLAGSRDLARADRLPSMAWRFDCDDVDPDELLAVHRRHRRGRIDVAVCVHGLMIDESCWTGAVNPFVDDLEGLFGWTTLFVRYNTGLHISLNGELLADRLEELHASWGPALGSIQLLGHSMGGLVARSALEVLRRRNATVLDHVERVFLLCTPNGGVEVEQLRYGVESALQAAENLVPALVEAMFPEERRNRTLRRFVTGGLLGVTASAAGRLPSLVARTARTIVAFPSDGMRDVRFGYMQRAEWAAHDNERLEFMTNHRRPLPPPDHVRAYAIAASLWPGTTTVPSRVRNDGIVTVASVASKTLDFDDLQLTQQGRFREVPLLVHQAAPVSHRVADVIEHWVTGRGT